jgi:hypothetical protein
MDSGEEVRREFVIPDGDASEVFEPSEHALDGVAAAQ